MERKKQRIVIVVAGGEVTAVFSESPIELEIVDYDGAGEEERETFMEYESECRAGMIETPC